MADPEYQATCFFLDIGQGSSQVIYLGGGKAIVIDGGPSAEVPLLLLDRYVDEIVALIVSHNDADHHRGAYQILERFRKTIGDVYFLEDRPFDRIGLYDLAERRLAERKIRGVVRLERSNRSHVLHGDEERGLSLDLLFPEFLDNLKARKEGDRNATSAVLAFSCGTRRIVFPGDAPLEAWRRIHRRLGAPIVCDVVAVPHHGGAVGRPPDSSEGRDAELMAGESDWLYKEAIRAEYAVISVGTSNRYGHPRPAVVRSLRVANERPAKVLCTQLTPQCCESGKLSAPDFKVLEPREWPGSRSDRGRDTAKPRGVSCAGTVVVKVGPDRIEVDRFEEHQDRINGLRADEGWHPLCRP